MKSIRHLTLTERLLLLEQATQAEMSRDLDVLRGILGNFWSDFKVFPDFEEYEPTVQAELFRLCGFFISFWGRSRGIKDCQPQAKNLLTRAIELFEEQQLDDKAAEAKIILAFSYWNTGEVSECGAILDIVEAQFSDNPYHYVYIRSKLNRLICLMWSGSAKDLKKAETLVNQISPVAALCKDVRIRAMFHSEAAILFWRMKKLDLAEFHYLEAVRIAKKSKNNRFIASNYNNLAFLYLEREDFISAHTFADSALKIYKKLGDTGWMAHVFDTKANILFAQKRYLLSINYIEKSLVIFTQTEDSNGLCNAIFTKVKCLLRLGHKEDALFCFGELQKISTERIGEIAARKFSNLLADEIYALGGLSFADEVSEFKIELVSDALTQANGKIKVAAEKLRLKHQTLSEMLQNQFPGLREDLGFKKKQRRKIRTVTLRSEDILEEKEISRLVLPEKNFSFPFDLESKQFEIFYFDKYFMSNFNVDSGAIVVVVPVNELKENQLILANAGSNFKIGKTQFDSMIGIYYITDQYGEPFPVSDENIIGEPKGFCSVKDSSNSFIRFEPLDFRG